MKKKFLFNSNGVRRQEAGVSWLVAIVFLLIGMYGALVFGFIPYVQRSSFLEIQALADNACGNLEGAASKIPVQAEMWETFSDYLDAHTRYDSTAINKPLRSIIKRATLYLSTPIDGTGSSFQGAQNKGSGGDYSGITIPSDPLSLTPATPHSLEVRSGINAEVRLQFGFAGAPLPSGSLDQVRNQGNTAVCVIEAEIDSALFGIPTLWLDKINGSSERIFSVVSASWAPATGVNSSPPLPVSGGTTLDPDSTPGLMIAIAPQMADLDSTSNFDRFKFSSGSQFETDGLYQTSSTGLTSLSNGFIFDSEGDSLPRGDMPGLTGITDSNEIIERRIGCLNPLTYVRNKFTSRLYGNAIRHGHYRWSTEVLVVNSKVMNSGGMMSSVTIPPALITENISGDSGDALNTSQAPYLSGFFPSDVGGGGRWITPLKSSASAGALILDKRDRLISGQLADCAHLFSGATHIESDITNSFSSNSLFEPGSFHLTNSLSNYSSATLNKKWFASVPDSSAGANDNTPLSMPKTLMTLGAVRVCPFVSQTLPPYDAFSFGYHALNSVSDVCRDRSSLSSYQIVPDLKGFFLYANRFQLSGQPRSYFFKPQQASSSTLNGNPTDATLTSVPVNSTDLSESSTSGVSRYPNIALITHDFPVSYPDAVGGGPDRVAESLNKGTYSGGSVYDDIEDGLKNDFYSFGVRPIITFAFLSDDPLSNTGLADRISTFKQAMRIDTGSGGLNQLVLIHPCMFEISGDGANAIKRVLFPDFCEHDAAGNPVHIKSFSNPLVSDPNVVLPEFWQALAGLSPGIPTEMQIEALSDQYFRKYFTNQSVLF